MKIIIDEARLRQICRNMLLEAGYSEDAPFYDALTDYDARYIFETFMPNPEQNTLWLPLINPAEYQQALNEFTKYGRLVRFPEKRVHQMMGFCLKNIALLVASNSINGHDQTAPLDEFVDVFFEDGGDNYGDGWEAFESYAESIGQDADFSAMWQYLDEHGYEAWDDKAGVDSTISDYGTDPLCELAWEYREDMSAEDTLILINRMLDVTHCRGDLSTLFIRGGAGSLDRISNSHYYGPL